MVSSVSNGFCVPKNGDFDIEDTEVRDYQTSFKTINLEHYSDQVWCQTRKELKKD